MNNIITVFDPRDQARTMTNKLSEFLTGIKPGPITDTDCLEGLIAEAWHELSGGDGGGMDRSKIVGRTEKVAWQSPCLTFTVERHGGTVLGSSRAMLQDWTVDLDRQTASYSEARTRQVRPMAGRVDVCKIAEEVTRQIVNHHDDPRLQWYPDGRVKVLVGKIRPIISPYKQTLTERRKRFRAALNERMKMEGWQECGIYTYSRI